MSGNRILISLAALSLAVAACGGGAPAATSPGGGVTPTDPPVDSPTEGPVATQSGGGNGGSKPAGWDQYGKVHIEIRGPVEKTADYGFIPAGSIFGGDQGSSLNFTVEGTNEIVSILIGADGKVIVSYGGEDFSAPAAECTTSNWNVGATSGSGSFDCQAAFVILASGATVSGATVKGNFEARAS